MLLSTAGGGLALGVLFTRWKMEGDINSHHIHNAFGSISTGCMLLTASLGGTYTRADSLTEFLPFVKETTPTSSMDEHPRNSGHTCCVNCATGINRKAWMTVKAPQ